MMVHSHSKVIEEFLRLPKKYQDPIADITLRMGEGMAQFQTRHGVDTTEDWNLVGTASAVILAPLSG